MIIPNDLTNSGIVNNVANRFFKLAIVVGPALAIIDQLASGHLNFFAKYFQQYIIAVQGVFAFLIFFIGEPTNKNWETNVLKEKIKGTEYYKTNSIDDDKLGDKIDFLKSFFSKYWGYLWGTWATLYITMSITYTIQQGGIIETTSISQIVLEIISNTLNYLNAYFILCLYFSLIHKFDSKKPKKDSSIDFYKSATTARVILIILVLSEIVIYLALASSTSNLLYMRNTVINVQNFYKTINGVISSVCFILFFSRIIGSFTTVLPYKKYLLPFLYIYCSVQPLFFMLEDNGMVSKDYDAFRKVVSGSILIIALVGKYLLYISVTWLFETKRILFHFIETHQLRDEIDGEIELFDKIWLEDKIKKENS